MQVKQVKVYNGIIARQKKEAALERWRKKDNGYGYPVDSMFFFMLSDRQGYPTTLRQKGYVAYTDNKACFGMTPKEALESFNSI